MQPSTSQTHNAAHRATELQQSASDPDASVWVDANAGSGKTKVLVDRVIRLLLDGVSPDHILCITYTTAAAAEMKHRVTKKTREFASMGDKTLHAALTALSGTTPSDATLKEARKLFTRLLDAAPGLRIMTIHAFCQQILQQFPDEAQVPPNFTILDDTMSAELLHRSAQSVLREAYQASDESLTRAIDALSRHISEDQFNALLREIRTKRREFLPIIRTPETTRHAIAALYDACNITEDTTQLQLQEHHLFLKHPTYQQTLRDCAACLCESSHSKKSDIDIGTILHAIVNSNDDDARHQAVLRILTNNHEIRKGRPTAAIKKHHASIAETIEEFFHHCHAYAQHWFQWQHATLSVHCITVAAAFHKHYTALKERYQALDYQDQIEKTYALFSDAATMPWVLYKLDGQIDHLLLDEAQDTSQAQWDITEKLTAEFFAGIGARTQARRLFVVGDFKQSIYGFQGAEPKAFKEKLLHYQQRAAQAGHEFRHVPMQTSFRSCGAILDLVDAFCQQENISIQQAIRPANDSINHHAFRAFQPGSVTLYPVISAGDTLPDEGWQTVDDRSLSDSPKRLLARKVAEFVYQKVNTPSYLAASDERITAGDILILVKTRTEFVEQLIFELRQRNIAVAGQDRITLRQHIAVKDLLALGEFVINPNQDTALAALLTSPLYALDYDQLTELCAQRASGETVWQRLQQSSHTTICNELMELSDLNAQMSPSQFFSQLLYAKRGAYRFAGRMGYGVWDVIDGFYQECERYEATAPSPSMHGFITWMRQHHSDLKRDLEQTNNQIRIMTVHGAKGLEAPIVILPDTCHLSDDIRNDILLPYTHQHTPLMLYKLGNQHQRVGIFAQAATMHKQVIQQEYMRLLYVALTRACDELHIFGATSRNRKKGDEAIPQESWYAHAKQALQHLGVEPAEDGTMYYTSHHEHSKHPHHDMLQEARSYSLPSYFTNPVHEQHKILPFASPSQLYDEKQQHIPDIVYSHDEEEAQASQYDAAQRGILMHRCLEYQCGQPYATFLTSLPTLLPLLAPDIEQKEIHNITNTLEQFTHYPEIIALLEQAALAEPSICGHNSDHIALHGQIDRLIITDKEVIILDFKTGKAPVSAEQIPHSYRLQMRAYEELVAPLFPDKTRRSLLLYFKPTPTLLAL